MAADVVLVPLEDGDRTEALVRLGKKVIAIDLNPLSRTSQKATITIVDNIVRAVPRLLQSAERLKKQGVGKCRQILREFDNRKNLAESICLIDENLSKFAEKGIRAISGGC
jgi:4-phosphopantoate--beta-alanine ligase